MSAKYERLPTTPSSPSSTSSSRSSSPSPTRTSFSPPPMTKSRAEAILANRELTRELQRKTDRDPRFNVPRPSTWKRVALLIFIVALVWLAVSLRMAAVKHEPVVVHANRYVFLPRPRYSFSFWYGYQSLYFLPMHLRHCHTKLSFITSLPINSQVLTPSTTGIQKSINSALLQVPLSLKD